MKTKASITLLSVLSFLFTQAQTTVSDFVVLGSQYANQSFYSLANGEKAKVSNTNWDLQFGTAQRSAMVRINDAKNIQAYALANPDTANWNSIDTIGMYRLYDSDTSWEFGALNNIGTLQHPDYGCLYYTGVGQLVGHRLFVLKLNNGEWKKIWIKSLDFYVFTILISDLDNSNEQTITIDKALYNTKNHFYYNLENLEVVDTQPDAEEWDLVFRKYYAIDSLTGLPFNVVTGTWSNRGVEIAEARGVDVNALDSDSGYTYSSLLNTIGFDWKEYDYDNAVFVLDQERAYFVKSVSGDIYKLVFTGFAGSSTGRIEFDKTNLSESVASVINTANSNINTLSLYPNPAQNTANILVSLKQQGDIHLSVYDVSGKEILSKRTSASAGLNNFYLETNILKNGFYSVKINDGKNELSQQLLVAH
jgi:hypothetical protein